MNLECPRCHKHQFKVRNFISSKSGGNDIPVSCPHCGALLTLDGRSATIINVITLMVFFGFLAVMIPLTGPRAPDGVEIAVLIAAVVLTGSTRFFAVGRFGKIAPYVVKRSEPYPRIRLVDVGSELASLRKQGDFFVLFTSDEEAYLSFIKKRDGITADLAFAIGKFEELEPRFREAVSRAGATAHPYKKRGMRGVEAKLGTDSESVAMKIRTIMQGTFGLNSDAEIPVMRQS